MAMLNGTNEGLVAQELGTAVILWRQSRRRMQKLTELDAPKPVIQFERNILAKRIRKVASILKLFGIKKSSLPPSA